MLKFVLWSILAVWVGIALVMLGTLLVTIVGSAARMVRDKFGKRGVVYCPVHERDFAVVGIPTSFGDAPFDDLLRCEAFERGEIQCKKSCLLWEQSSKA